MMMDDVQAEKRAKRFWVSLVVGLLGLQVAIGGYAVSMATSEHAPVVLPNYHQSALDWDNTRKQRDAIKQLGWQISVEPSDIVDGRGKRALRVTILDPMSIGVDGIQLSALAYHQSNANDVVDFSLQPVTGGDYQAVAALTRSGWWHLELVAEYDGQSLRSVHTLELK